MQKDLVDQELSFKKRARRRLVGAVALVLLMVIILPMVLEDREKAIQQQDVEIVMPNEVSELEVPVQLSTEDGFEASAVQSVDEEGAVEDEAVSVVVALPKAAEQPTQPEPKKVIESEQKKPANKVEKEKISTAKALVASNQYYVQIGVFSDPSNIKKLQAKLDGLGYKSLTEKLTTDTGVKTRLRTESFDGRNEAAIALQNIKDAGLAGMVVNQK